MKRLQVLFTGLLVICCVQAYAKCREPHYRTTKKTCQCCADCCTDDEIRSCCCTQSCSNCCDKVSCCREGERAPDTKEKEINEQEFATLIRILTGNPEQAAQCTDKIKVSIEVHCDRKDKNFDPAVWQDLVNTMAECVKRAPLKDNKDTWMYTFLEALKQCYGLCGDKTAIHGGASVGFESNDMCKKFAYRSD